MLDAEKYIRSVIAGLKRQFGERLLYVGLQGSYLRGEAEESSDIDVVVILDVLEPKDLAAYKALIEGLEAPEKSCGIICGREEMAAWNPLEVCSFLNATKDYYGALRDYMPAFTRQDVVHFIKLSAGNLYHEICHRFIHRDEERNRNALPYSYKGVFFILQCVYYLKHGVFYPNRAELMKVLEEQDKAVLEMGIYARKNVDYDFDRAFSLLHSWCKRIMKIS